MPVWARFLLMILTIKELQYYCNSFIHFLRYVPPAALNDSFFKLCCSEKYTIQEIAETLYQFQCAVIDRKIKISLDFRTRFNNDPIQIFLKSTFYYNSETFRG